MLLAPEGRACSGRITGFHNRYDNLVVASPGSPPLFPVFELNQGDVASLRVAWDL